MAHGVLLSVAFLAGLSLFFALLLILAEKKLLNYGPCAIEVNGGEKALSVKGGVTLLSGLMSQDIYIPSACGGRGSCAYCKVTVSEGGGPLTPVEESILAPAEAKANVRLSCQVKIRGPLKIRVPRELFSIRRFSGRIARKRDLTHDTLELRIELLDPPSIDFIAGQYVQLETTEYKGREAVMRAYSISSLPSDRRFLELVVRRVPGGICTTWVFDVLKEGEPVKLSGPYGEFRLSASDAPMVFVAGGSGMAPFWSILRHMKEQGIRREAAYFYGATAERDLYFADDLKAMEKELPGFTFVPTLTQASPSWTGSRGRVTEAIPQAFKDLSRYEGYLCGSPGMIESSIQVMTGLGMAREKIYFDKFA